MVIKKDKSRESFDRHKILSGLMRACEKRQISMDSMENLIDEIENYIYNSLEKEVSSSIIGEMVMEKLKKIDPSSICKICISISTI